MKLKLKYILIPVIILLAGVFITTTYRGFVSKYNESITIEAKFNSMKDNRLSVLQNITTIVRDKLRIAKVNDTSFQLFVNDVVSSRKDSGVAFKWITENYSNLDRNQVNQLYNEVVQSIDKERHHLYAIETQLQDTKREYTVHRTSFPNKVYLFYRPDYLKYIPIASTVNRTKNETGDDNTDELKTY